MPEKIKSRFYKFVVALVFILAVSAIYLHAFPSPTITYAGIVLLHAGAGLIAALCLVRFLWRFLHQLSLIAKIGWLLFTVSAGLGVLLTFTGTTRPEMKWLNLHIAAAGLAVVVLMAEAISRRLTLKTNLGLAKLRVATIIVLAAIAGGIGFSAHALRDGRWLSSHLIKNPPIAPVSMNEEGDGPKGNFFPSSAQVVSGGHIPSKFFMESDSCKRCHQDIYNDWNASAHHFSSFNNQWYRKSIEYMQDVVGPKPSKWCGGCHDPAVLYSGLMDTPIKQIVHRPEAQAGLGCMMCHSIAKVKSTMGQGDFYLEYPKLHELAASKNPIVRTLHDFLVKLNPEPHRRVFLKPFMREQTPEFCSSCHKVHLDVPVNQYRWIRGFNEYDNWQASGVSGQGARSFYYPKASQQCADCHMPLQASKDFGNVSGFVHSHRFPGANTAVPTANEDVDQLKLTEDFLKTGALTVDIFALSPAQAPLKAGATAQSDLSTTFAVGEEAESKINAESTGEAAPITAPLNRVLPPLRRGDTVRVEVV